MELLLGSHFHLLHPLFWILRRLFVPTEEDSVDLMELLRENFVLGFCLFGPFLEPFLLMNVQGGNHQGLHYHLLRNHRRESVVLLQILHNLRVDVGEVFDPILNDSARE